MRQGICKIGIVSIQGVESVFNEINVKNNRQNSHKGVDNFFFLYGEENHPLGGFQASYDS